MLNIDTRKGGAGLHTLILSGEFDLFERDKVETHLAQVLLDSPESLIIDLSSVSLIDSSGIGLLIAYCGKLKEAGIQVAIIVDNASYLVRKLNYLGIFDSIGVRVFSSVNDAELAFVKP